MTTDPRPWDVTELDAGNARGLTSQTDADPGELQAIRTPRLDGNLDDAAARLGVDVADLVRMRRQMGIAPAHRRLSVLDRLFRRG
jgi:aryl-alcohol dehydrogenase-like predicted oxidoreductase